MIFRPGERRQSESSAITMRPGWLAQAAFVFHPNPQDCPAGAPSFRRLNPLRPRGSRGEGNEAQRNAKVSTWRLPMRSCFPQKRRFLHSAVNDILRAVSKVSTTPSLPGSFLANGQHYKQQSESPDGNIVPLVTPRIPPKLKAAKGPPAYPLRTDH
jgi:hypothetical protein